MKRKMLAATIAAATMTSFSAPAAQATQLDMAAPKPCGEYIGDLTLNDIINECPDYAVGVVLALYGVAADAANHAIDCVQEILDDPYNTSINDINDCLGLVKVAIQGTTTAV